MPRSPLAVRRAPLCWSCQDTYSRLLLQTGDVPGARAANERALALLPERSKETRPLRQQALLAAFGAQERTIEKQRLPLSQPEAEALYEALEKDVRDKTAYAYHPSTANCTTKIRDVMDRAMAIPGHPMDLDDLKIIVLMVYWSIGLEPDALVLDELCDDADRIAH